MGVGYYSHIIVTGCAHTTVGPIVRGNFAVCGENHGKPSFKRDLQANGLDVMIYFWDSRDGPSFCGWWFGPKVGGDQVWAYHPSTDSLTPPTSGWKVPYDGPADPSFILNAAGQPVAPPSVAAAQQVLHARMTAQQQQRLEQQQRIDEMNRSRAEEQRLRVEAVKRQQEELHQAVKKQQEEIQRRQQEDLRKREEQRATLEIRRVLQQLKLARPETIEAMEKELQVTMAKELPNCGSLMDTMRQESAVGLEQAKQRAEKIHEQEERFRSAQVEANRLLHELTCLVADAEASAKKLTQAAGPFTAMEAGAGVEETPAPADAKELAEMTMAVEVTGGDAKARGKLCTDFILANGALMKPTPPPGTVQSAAVAQREAAALTEMLKRINEFTKTTETTLQTFKEKREKLGRLVMARQKRDQLSALFDKYDKDCDDLLSRKEILRYAKEEFHFEIQLSWLDQIFDVLVEKDTRGIKKADFHELIMAIGLARERAKDAVRRSERIEREKRTAEIKGKLAEKVVGTSKRVVEAEEAVRHAEAEASQAQAAAASMSSVAIVERAAELDTLLVSTREKVANVKVIARQLGDPNGIDEAHLSWITGESARLEARVTPLEGRLSTAGACLERLRVTARRRQVQELGNIEARVLKLFRQRRRTNKESREDLYGLVDTNKDDRIDEQEFRSFVRACEAVDPPTNGVGDSKDTKADEHTPMTEEELSTLFDYWDEEDEGFVPKDRFSNMLRLMMMVCRDTVVTTAMAIREAKVMKRLDIGDVVEILEGPFKEEVVNVLRVRARVVREDLDLEGWITYSGNTGSVYLEEDSTARFKVLQPTVLTEAFNVNGVKASRATQDRPSCRTLEKDELVEPIEWPLKDAVSGSQRLKCRAVSDGSTGWATVSETTGGGSVFLELVSPGL